MRLANPLSDEQPLMRTRLLATMVDALRRNVARGTRDVGLFELGLVVALDGPQGSAPTEDVGIRPSDETLAAIRAAVPPQPRHVGLPPRGRPRCGPAGGVPAARPTSPTSSSWPAPSARPSASRSRSRRMPCAPFHPGRCARVTLADGTLVGHVGELHPKVVAALGLPARTVGGELDLDVLTVGVRGDRAGAHPRHLPDGAERRRRRRRRVGAGRCRAALPARRRRVSTSSR